MKQLAAAIDNREGNTSPKKEETYWQKSVIPQNYIKNKVFLLKYSQMGSIQNPQGYYKAKKKKHQARYFEWMKTWYKP